MTARVSLALVGAMAALVVGAAVLGVSESPSHASKAAAPPTTFTVPPTTTTVPPPTTTGTVAPAMGTVPTTTTLAPTPNTPLRKCTFSALAVSLGHTLGANGHLGFPIHFRNVGTTTCTVYGYPGVALLNATVQQVAQATRTTEGFIGGMRTGLSTPPTAILAPGQTATAMVEVVDIVGVTGTTSCPTYSAMLVTPPTTTESVHLTTSMVACLGVQVHPVVATRATTPGSTQTPTSLTVTQLTVVGMTGPDAAALSPLTGQHLGVWVTAEQVEPTLVSGTILIQGQVTGNEALVNVAIAVPQTSPCRATQLAMVYSGSAHASASDWGYLVVRDTSPAWCSLVGPLTEWGAASTGSPVTSARTMPVVPFVLTGGLTTPLSPFLRLRIGVVQAAVPISALASCLGWTGGEPTAPPPPVTPATLALSLPTGGTLSTPNQPLDHHQTHGQFVACAGMLSGTRAPLTLGTNGQL